MNLHENNDAFAELIETTAQTIGLPQIYVESTVSRTLLYLEGGERESKGSKFRKTVYQYPRNVESADFGQASPELLLEINAFTRLEPYELRELKTFIAEVLEEKDQQQLIDQFGLQSYCVNVLSVKRTLVEKMLGVIKDSYHTDPIAKLSDRIRAPALDQITQSRNTDCTLFVAFACLCRE